MNRSAIITSLVAMFLVGASLGLVGGLMYSHFGHGGWRHHGVVGGWRGQQGPGGPGSRDHDPLPRLTHALDLTPQQVERIRPMLVQSKSEFAAVRESLRVRISRELTAEQQVRWQKLIEEKRLRSRAHGAARDSADGSANPGDTK